MLVADYCFGRNRTDDDLICLVVMRIYPHGMYFASVVDQKGYDSNAIEAAAAFISSCGLTEFVYRADRERAITKFLGEVVEVVSKKNIKGVACEAIEDEDGADDTLEQGDIETAEAPCKQ